MAHPEDIVEHAYTAAARNLPPQADIGAGELDQLVRAALSAAFTQLAAGVETQRPNPSASTEPALPDAKGEPLPLEAVEPLEWVEDTNRSAPFNGPEVVRIWDGKSLGQRWATIIECDDGEFTLLSMPTCERFKTMEAAQAGAHRDFATKVLSIVKSPVSHETAAGTPGEATPGWETPQEWELEQRAFNWANAQSIPEAARRTVADLWRLYCAAANPERGNNTQLRLQLERILAGNPTVESAEEHLQWVLGGITAVVAAMEATKPPAAGNTAPPLERPEINDEFEILRRLVEGDQIIFSYDGDMAWFANGDRAFVGDLAIISLRHQGYLMTIFVNEDEDHGGEARATISEAGRDAFVGCPQL